MSQKSRLSRSFSALVLLLVLAPGFLASGCRTTSVSATSKIKSKHSDAGVQTVTISGDAANKLIAALQDAGVRDQTGAIGGLSLQVKSIVCASPVVPDPVPECELTMARGTIKPSAGASLAINNVLADHGGFLDDGRVGANVTMANDVECTQAVVPDPQGQCSFKVGVAPNFENIEGKTITISGNSARNLMGALADSGVKDDADAIGAKNLVVDIIECSVPVAPGAKASCELTVGQTTFSAKPGSAKVINDILVKNGASLRDGRVGAAVATATQVECSRPEVPNSKTTCSFSVSAAR